MFEKDFDNKIFELIKKYQLAKEQGTLSFIDENDFEQIFIYYFNNLDYDNALEVVNDGIEIHKYSSVFYNQKAEIFKELGKYHEALEILFQADAFSPNEMAIILNKVDIYSILENYDVAINLLKKVIDKSQGIEKAELYLELADVYEDAENYKKVIWALTECLQIDNQNEEALNRIWFSVELTEDYEFSIKFHKTLIDLNPYNYLAWNNLGHAYRGYKKHNEAIDAFEFVMAINETYESAYIDCADVYFNIEKYNKAIDLYTEVLDFTSRKKEIFFSIGKCYEELKNYTKARDFYRESLSIDPYFAKAFYHVGRTYLVSNSPKSALKQLEKAYKLDDKNIEFQLALADAYLLLNEYDKSLEIYKKIIDSNETNKQIHLNLITILFESGDVLGALQYIDSIIDKFKDVSDLLYIQVAFLYDIDRIEDAKAKLYEALEYNPKMSHLLIELLPYIAEDKEFMKIIDKYK